MNNGVGTKVTCDSLSSNRFYKFIVLCKLEATIVLGIL